MSEDVNARILTTKSVSEWRRLILKRLGFTNQEVETICVIADLQSQSKDAEAAVYSTSLTSIGLRLSRSSDDAEVQKKTAVRRTGSLFNHAQPRVGIQAITRYKGDEDHCHQYQDHITPLAELADRRFKKEILPSSEWKSALAIRDRAKRAESLMNLRYRLIDVLTEFLPLSNAQLINPVGEDWGIISEEQAEEFCESKDGWHWIPYTYSPSLKPSAPLRPWTSQDIHKAEKRIRERFETEIEKVMTDGFRSNPPSFNEWANDLLSSLYRSVNSVLKVSSREEQAEGILIGDIFESESDRSTAGGWSFSPEAAPQVTENQASCNGQRLTKPGNPIPDDLVSNEAFTFAHRYLCDGWRVIPTCWIEDGACGCKWHNEKDPCNAPGKAPLWGYDKASNHFWEIECWYREYPKAGVAIRMDDCVCLDYDKKEGGLGTRAEMRERFDLPETLTADTQSDGIHDVYVLPYEFDKERLKSWKGVQDGLDLRVDARGIIVVEPTVGTKGAYRWRNYGVDIATLPSSVCEWLIEQMGEKKAVREQEKTVNASLAIPATAGSVPMVDQLRYFKDVPIGARHERLFNIGNALRRQRAASVEQIINVLRWHGERFSERFTDDDWIVRSANEICENIPPTVVM